MSPPIIDVIIPARGGSTGLPGKNGRPLMDRPLLAHSVACAERIDGVRRILLTTDDPDLAAIGKQARAWVPELRPADLARDDTAMVDVIRHCVTLLSSADAQPADLICLLDPTSPLRDPSVISGTARELAGQRALDGAISISIPAFNPLWVGVERAPDGEIRRHPLLVGVSGVYTRRQDVPPYWRINGSFYLWRTPFAASISADWLDQGRFLGVQTPELLSHSIDTLDDFRLVEALLQAGVVQLPWLSTGNMR